MTASEELETKAMKIGDNPKALLKRLNQAKARLSREYKERFKIPIVDLDNRRLISSCGKYVLEWRLRQHPDKEISYDNQQSSIGEVHLLLLNPYQG